MSSRGRWNICQTNYPHPDVMTSQNTNGPWRVWVEVDGQWHNTGSQSLRRVLRELERYGAGRIVTGTWHKYAALRREGIK